MQYCCLLLVQNFDWVLQADWHHGYWVPDMGFQCFTGWHLKVALALGLPLLLLTWLVIPLMPTLLLFSRRQELNKPEVQLQLGYIYQCYK